MNMTGNGEVDTATAEEATAEEAIQETAAAEQKPWLHPDALTPRDYLRAKTALAEVLDGRSPYELLIGEEMYPFCIWALRSRQDPSFTWEQALDTPFHQFRMGDEPPPPPRGGPPGSPGPAAASTGPAGSSSKRRPITTAPSSAPSST